MAYGIDEPKTKIPINRKDVVNVVCELDRVPSWVEAMLEHGYSIRSIDWVDPIKNQLNSNTIWNVIGIKESLEREEWFLNE